jgi:hypothetical protein
MGLVVMWMVSTRGFDLVGVSECKAYAIAKKMVWVDAFPTKVYQDVEGAWLMVDAFFPDGAAVCPESCCCGEFVTGECDGML